MCLFNSSRIVSRTNFATTDEIERWGLSVGGEYACSWLLGASEEILAR